MEKGFRQNVLCDTILTENNKRYILAPGQAFKIWERGWFKRSPKVTVEVVDVLTYVNPKQGTQCLLSDATGEACYQDYSSCMDSSTYEGRQLLGYGCGKRSYRVSRYGLRSTAYERLTTNDVAELIVRARQATSKKDDYTVNAFNAPYGVCKPVFMTPVTSRTSDKQKKVAWDVIVPGTSGTMSCVQVPIPLLLTGYKDFVPAGYTEADINLHLKIWQKSVDGFLNRNKIDTLYIALPFEGTSAYSRVEDAEKLYTEQEYETYKPTHTFRVVQSNAWQYKDRFSLFDGSDRDIVLSAIARRRLDSLI